MNILQSKFAGSSKIWLNFVRYAKRVLLVRHGYLNTYTSDFYKLGNSLKGTATLMITMFYMKDLNKPWILIPVSSNLVEECGSCGRLNICKWTVMEAAIL